MSRRSNIFGRHRPSARRHSEGARSAITGEADCGDVRPADLPEPESDSGASDRRQRRFDRDLRYRPPILPVWIAALVSLSFFAAVVWYFGNVYWTRAAVVSFLAVEALFLTLGIYWVVLGWRRGWRAVQLGGAVTLIPLVLLVFCEMSKTREIGGYRGMVPVRVMDARSGDPVPGAKVHLSWPAWKDSLAHGETDSAGVTCLEYKFETSAAGTLLRKHGRANLMGYIVTVDAEGFEPRQVELASIIGQTWDIYGPPLPEVEIRLVRK